MIGVIDYKAGNSASMLTALRRVGAEAALFARPEGLDGVDRLILPGVGSARATMDTLGEAGWVEALERLVLRGGMPFLGVCVGLQVLFAHSAEEDTDTLGFLPGRVTRFPAGRVRVPQIGWNAVTFRRAHPLLKGLGTTGHFYFVNSYHAVPASASDILAETDYGGVFCSAVARDNLAATQFHLEKSGETGLAMLKNFAAWNGGGG
ncbi:MAG: imidazole glycerol phosphate synthase subunit HisH [Oscillospiraceae bacterium]|jgi:glutamine amidotransferase|nr:imidazole glycerol phosphate synthase subunit HisH [Oscillospiraceae bacterium]